MLLFLLLSITLSIKGNLNDKLAHYELVQIERQVVKRGIEKPDPSRYNRIEKVVFRAFNRHFCLYLTPKRGLLDAGLKAFSVDDHGHRLPFHIDPDEFYEGHLHGSPNSRISASFDGETALTANIETNEETFIFEPAWRHIPKSSPRITLAYRASDVIFGLQKQSEGPSLCEFVQIDAETVVNLTTTFREKRQVSTDETVVKNRCPIKVVADYRFYETIGNRSIAFSARYLINMIDRVNDLYTRTDWGQDSLHRRLTNMGFMIRDILIHTTPTVTPRNTLHYNMDRGVHWGVSELLNLFADEEGSDNFCLVHLFTSQAFNGGVLGLGFIAGPNLGSAGGICTAAAYKNGKIIYFNTALSSAKSTLGDTVITREADIVTAHEFGHNWGSYHDPATEECSPSFRDGGSYIMHTYSVGGYDKNNKRFSPCSKRMIGAVLSSKSELCFEAAQDRFCGNGRVENGTILDEDEQCDGGGLVFGQGRVDKCCNLDCKLNPGAQCSPKNSPCCTDECQFKPATELCLAANPLHCKRPSFCTGHSGNCPNPASLPDGELCFEGGECQQGRCVTFCERRSIGRKPCICVDRRFHEIGTCMICSKIAADSCYRCCRSIDEHDCQPYSRSKKFLLRNGTRCIHGYCKQGICIKEVTDVVSHLWNIIDRLDRTTFWKFVQDNLVGIVIIVTLLFWIPACLVVNYLDQQVMAEKLHILESLKYSNILENDENTNPFRKRRLIRYPNAAS